MTGNSSLMNKIKVDWAKDPEKLQGWSPFQDENLSLDERQSLFSLQEQMLQNKGSSEEFTTFDAYYAMTYNSFPSKEELEENTQTAQRYYKAASTFQEEIQRLKKNDPEKEFSTDEYVGITKASLKKMALQDAINDQGQTILTDEMRKHLTKGLAAKNIPVTEDTLQKMYRFYMSRML